MQGLTQTELGKALDVNRNNIASYESGMVEPNANLFIKTCQFFDIDPKEMLVTIMSQSPISNTLHISEDIKTIDQYIIDQFEIFVHETNNSTKILEGFTTFQSFDELKENVDDKELNNILGDLLSVFDQLLKINWELIHKVIPSDELET